MVKFTTDIICLSKTNFFFKIAFIENKFMKIRLFIFVFDSILENKLKNNF
jgi:hypothetical protein